MPAVTLFVRNIGFETDAPKFKEFMEKFGAVNYAVLCKQQAAPDLDGENSPGPGHRGTGFVQFKNRDAAVQLLELSRKVEEHLDKERKNFRLKQASGQNLVSSLSLLQNEIELDGRRLIVKEQVSKDEAGKLRENRKLEDKRKKEEEDKRNLGMAKEGLLNEAAWIHQTPPLSKTAMELRQRLYVAKDKALKNTTNLYISKTRLQLRNLPRRDFFEAELKELMRVVAEEWSKTLAQDEQRQLYVNKKLITHVKIMRDEEKTDSLTGENLPSGQAFVEFKNEALALFAVHYLNNLEIVSNKGLIVDFSMEDQRALFKRKEKIERWRQIAKDKKLEETTEKADGQEPKSKNKPEHKKDSPMLQADVEVGKSKERSATVLDLGEYWSK